MTWLILDSGAGGVSLIATEATHLDLLDAGGPGVRIRQHQLTDSSATVEVSTQTKLSSVRTHAST